MTPEQLQLSHSRAEADRARARLMATLGSLQFRLHPTTIANQAREGVKDKGRELAEDAVQAVKDRPIAVSGVAAGIALFLARKPILSAISDFFANREPADENIVIADLDTQDDNFDLTAPTVDWSKKQGARA